MGDMTNFLSANGLWLLMWLMAMVGGVIFSWFVFRGRELRVHQELRAKEMAHLQKMKELEIELERARAHRYAGQAA